MNKEASKAMITSSEVSSRLFRSRRVRLALLGLLALAAPVAVKAQENPEGATFRTGLGYTYLRFTDRTPTTSTHDFAIVDFGVSKSFGKFFVGFDTELPFNQGGTPTNNEMVQ